MSGTIQDVYALARLLRDGYVKGSQRWGAFQSIIEALDRVPVRPPDRSDAMIEWVKQAKTYVKDSKELHLKEQWWRGRESVADEFLVKFDKPKEHHMTLAEIAREAKEGDRVFGTNPRTSDMFFDPEGVLCYFVTKTPVSITQHDLTRREWEFSFRPCRCPRCGKVLDE